MEIEEVGLFESKTHLSEMVKKVSTEGKVYRITKRGKPLAELRPIDRSSRVRLRRGYGRGSLTYMAPDFDEPLGDFKEYM